VSDRRALMRGDSVEATHAINALERLCDEAIDAGIDLIQIRERDLEAGMLRDLAGRVASRARGTMTRVVVNDRADVALASGASGVHLRSDGPSVARVRALGGLSGSSGSPWIVGRSVHASAEAAASADADYLLFGTVFPSASKGAGAPVAGVPALRDAVAASGATPVLAIGGITPAAVAACRAAGAAGVAAIGVFLPPGAAPGAMGPAAAARALRAAWGR
jgi:thiamine-phosphate pyrophosphorylase